MDTRFPRAQNGTLNKKVVLQISLAVILFTVIALQLVKKAPTEKPSKTDPKTSTTHPITSTKTKISKKSSSSSTCDLFTGQWIPNLEAPYYTQYTCGVIQDHQNCLKYGRPDTDFLKWKWKPDGCDLPVFNPRMFLEIVRDKSMAFVGDSVARNHMQSLVCLLSRVEQPVDVSVSKDENLKRWYYRSYNFTVVILWSPYLVRTQENDRNGRTGKTFWGIHLDTADEIWTEEIDNFHYVLISAGHWWFRPLIYYENNLFIGCRYCELDDLREYSLKYGYRNAFRTAFKAILERKNFKGTVFLRTFAPAHYEGGEWDQGGDCLRTQPYHNKTTEVNLKGRALALYSTQMEEFREAQELAQQRGLSFRLMDMTRLMALRPDGHPSKYGRPADQRNAWPSDCVHWCLPGPVDTWNDFLLEMLS